MLLVQAARDDDITPADFSDTICLLFLINSIHTHAHTHVRHTRTVSRSADKTQTRLGDKRQIHLLPASDTQTHIHHRASLSAPDAKASLHPSLVTLFSAACRHGVSYVNGVFLVFFFPSLRLPASINSFASFGSDSMWKT